MKIQFDSNQDFQKQAIQAVVSLFEGQALNGGNTTLSFQQSNTGSQLSTAFTEKGVGNNLILTEEQILSNLHKTQIINNLPKSDSLKGLNFSIEMETGTGKTYTYLRTIYELYQTYGFQKFVIVVPSVAIREGVLKNLEITHSHFQELYQRPSINFYVYDSKKLSNLRSFATNNAIQILVLNIDSFTKDNNIINQKRENGIRPIEFIQATKPIVIVDEPQNMETDVRRNAIESLNPFCTLRYSATHRQLYNHIYSLNPVRAYQLGLVKQIEVDGIVAEDNLNSAFIHVEDVLFKGGQPIAKLKIMENTATGVAQKSVTVGVGIDLYSLSKRREVYKHNFIVEELDSDDKTIQFSGGLLLKKGQTNGGFTQEITKQLIDETVKKHFEKERMLKPLGIKVLSLFFIDKVANYRKYDENGNNLNGIYADWFEESYKKYQKLTTDLILFEAESVHNGYFSQDKNRFKDTSGETKADNDTYSLIMKDKERLLNLNEPLRFIFSHSALSEGWDNPNVFQICTLAENKSEIRKRQQIGRGLRLPVDNNGVRIMDKNINILTVLANESYLDFSAALQKEIEEDTGVQFPKEMIKNAREKKQIKRSKDFNLHPEFENIWNLIKQKTIYRVDYQADKLIEEASKKINGLPPTQRPSLIIGRSKLHFTENGIENTSITGKNIAIKGQKYQIPDVYAYIQSRVNIKRETIFNILLKSDRIGDLIINPQIFLDNVVQILKRTLEILMADNIEYKLVEGSYYQMKMFFDEEIEAYLSSLFQVNNHEKTLYNYILTDSETEKQFAKDCEKDENIQFYFKLPKKFKIPTPIGNYNPDWAVVFENDNKIYFVAETKSEMDVTMLRTNEGLKIHCAKAHFTTSSENEKLLRYRHTTDLKTLINDVE
jgi:type III restriction enzyme